MNITCLICGLSFDQSGPHPIRLSLAPPFHQRSWGRRKRPLAAGCRGIVALPWRRNRSSTCKADPRGWVSRRSASRTRRLQRDQFTSAGRTITPPDSSARSLIWSVRSCPRRNQSASELYLSPRRPRADPEAQASSKTIGLSTAKRTVIALHNRLGFGHSGFVPVYSSSP